mgnify:CR=1 FL=1
MLSVLHIENIAVIEQANISFDRGFNVLTGETGAGKSIVIDAISAILGERTYRDVIRTGAERLGWTLDELLEKTLHAMADTESTVAEELNLLLQA